jgi:hypothetical protein
MLCWCQRHRRGIEKFICQETFSATEWIMILFIYSFFNSFFEGNGELSKALLYGASLISTTQAMHALPVSLILAKLALPVSPEPMTQ